MGQDSYDGIQKSAFGNLVSEGVYDTAFDHSDPVRVFFRNVFTEVLGEMDPKRPLSIIDCGCGPGAWLNFAGELCENSGFVSASLYGFDLTPEMVHVAAERVADRIDSTHLQQGDILDGEAYRFADHDNGYDVIYTYDVIQQLPRSLQLRACEFMSEQLGERGVMIIFDHDCQTKFGRVMGMKKFITRYLGIGLVPRYYCNARYPRLSRIARELQRSGKFSTVIHTTPQSPKRALVVRRARP